MPKPEKKLIHDINDIPKKLFYKIGETSRITQLESYVLRYWETEFPFLKPKKGKSGQRLYQRKDIDLIFEIKRLLYDEKFTIEGVRKRLAKNYIGISKSSTPIETDDQLKNQIKLVKNKLKELLKSLQ